jgi:type II secretory ATPase GspE/PulE/Tfp pilus assembly ATPase PilB-like protein
VPFLHKNPEVLALLPAATNWVLCPPSAFAYLYHNHKEPFSNPSKSSAAPQREPTIVLASLPNPEVQLPKSIQQKYKAQVLSADNASATIGVEKSLSGQERWEIGNALKNQYTLHFLHVQIIPPTGDPSLTEENSPLSLLFQEAKKLDASDIHIQITIEGDAQIRVRTQGNLYPLKLDPTLIQKATNQIKIEAGICNHHNTQPIDGKFDFQDRQVRVNICPTILGESIVLRLLPKFPRKPKSLTDIGFLPEDALLIENLINNSHGLIAVAGPTGSGRTTTLVSALSLIDTQNYKTITGETPVETLIPNTTQIPVEPPLTFAEFIKTAIRQDPDYIIVGEIRDSPTAEAAIQAAITGHVVLTTLHSLTCKSALQRLQTLGICNFLLADALRGIIAQRLARIPCPHCRRPIPLAEDLRIHLPEDLRDEPYLFAFEGEGCKHCNHQKTVGRTLLYEIFVTNPRITTSQIKTPEGSLTETPVTFLELFDSLPPNSKEAKSLYRFRPMQTLCAQKVVAGQCTQSDAFLQNH